MPLSFNNITAQEFVREFAKQYRAASMAWDGVRRNTAWTTFMIGEADRLARTDFGLLGKIAESRGFRIDAEYLRVDQLWSYFFTYDEPNTHRTHGMGDTPWRISVAIEHENEASRFLETLRKLGALNVPLKVLITYPYNGQYEASILLENANTFMTKERTDPHNSYLLGFGPDWGKVHDPEAWCWHEAAGNTFRPVQSMTETPE